MKNTSHISWFSIIEVLIGIFIFTLGLISIYLIMVSSLQLNDYNKNQIIASNLAREQIELMRNVRDSNYKTLHAWNWIPNAVSESTPKFSTGSYYKIENNLSGATFPVDIGLLWSDPTWINPLPEWQNELPPAWWMVDYRLCLDSENRYIFCPGDEETPFYKYVKIESLPGVTDAVKVISKVIWYKRGYHELEINTILADWKRL